MLTAGSSHPEPILCFSSIDWDFIWQGHQEVMSTLADQGHRVLFVENTGVRNPRITDVGRIRRRLANWRRSLQGFREERKNLTLYSPLILPFPYSRLARWVNRWLVTSALRRWMDATDFHWPICWTFLPTPLTLDLIHRIPHRILIYYCIDSFADSTPAAHRIVSSEQRLFREADLVFVTSHRLCEEALRRNPRVHLFPFGVSLQTFLGAEDGRNSSPPVELARCRRPIVGYVGGVHQWVDQEILCELARAHPDCSLVLVGPIQTEVEWLRRFPNVVLTGQKPHDELPRYVRHFDVGIIPYRLTEYTRHVYPTKLNEYHILGKPVISTPLPEVIAFNRRYGGLVEIAGDARTFSRAVHSALDDSSEDLVRRRQAAARDNSWEHRLDAMRRLIRQAVQEKESPSAVQWKVRFEASLNRSRRVLRAVAAVLLTLALVFETPLIWLIAGPLRLPERIQPADAIVVFAGGVGELGQPGQGYQERVQRALELFRKGLAPKMVFVSGYTWAFQEASIMRALAEGLGVPASAITTITDVQNTRDYVFQIKPIVRRDGWQEILLVTSPYHTRRAQLTFVRNLPELEVFQAPVKAGSFYSRRRGIRLRQLKALAHEAAAILYYRFKGWL